jgi:hypothetical protein
MTKEEMEEIYEFVLRSGLAPDLVYKVGDEYSDRFENFRAFAFHVAEKEREECAKIADEWALAYPHPSKAIADTIRARGQE